jgi:hypothetical protein
MRPSDDPGTVPAFGRDPEHMAGHRTTARGVARLLTILAATVAVVAAAPASARDPVDPKPPGGTSIVFPIVGTAEFFDDFGDPRGQGRHEGMDIMAPRKALAVAAEAGRVKFWTTSSRAGCTLYLYGESGTTYLYIHLNNDLGASNDNKGTCVPGVAYARGLKSGAKVAAGQHIAFVGDSGDANGIHPHLHFEVHPKDGAAVNPRPYLLTARRLLFAAKPGTTFTLAVTGKVNELGNGVVELTASSVRQWPGSRLIRQPGLPVRLLAAVTPESADDATQALLAPPSALTKGRTITVFTPPAKVTLAAQAGEDGALTVTRLVFR